MVDIVQVGLSVDSREVDKGTKSLDKLGKQGDKTKKATDKMSGSFKLLGSAIAAIGLTKLIENVISTAAAFEKMEASLVTVTGSAKKATEAMSGITQFATSTPYQVEEITDAFIKLKALGIEPTEANLRSFGNTSSAMGKSLNQMIEAVADAATGEFERLKEFGIKSRSEGDRVKFTFQGVTTEVGKNSKEITQYLEDIGQTQFAGAMEKQMNTLDGVFSNFSDSVSLAIKKLSGESGFNNLIKNATKGLSLFIRELSGTSTLEDVNTRISTTQKEIDKLNKTIEDARAAKPEDRGWLSYIIGASPEGIITDATQKLSILQQQLKIFQAEAEAIKESTGSIDKAGAGGGGDGVIALTDEQLDAEFERLSAQTDRELEEMSAAEEAKLDLKRGYWERLYDMETGSMQAISDFGRAIADGDLQKQIEVGTLALSNSAKQSKTMFEISKAYSLAKAVAALPSAVMDSFNNGGGYPWGLVPAGLMLATGLQQINAIKSATFGGGATTSSVSGGSTSAGTPTSSGLPDGSTATPEGLEEPVQQKEIRVTVEGESANSNAMRQFILDLEETAADMGSDTRLVLS